jgi:hypothetical protein
MIDGAAHAGGQRPKAFTEGDTPQKQQLSAKAARRRLRLILFVSCQSGELPKGMPSKRQVAQARKANQQHAPR